MRGYSETFWNLFSELVRSTFAHCQIQQRSRNGEGGAAGVAFNKFVRALPLAIPSYTVESSPLYLFKQKVNKPSSTFNQLEREAIPSSSPRDI